jgi:hypothetical protein
MKTIAKALITTLIIFSIAVVAGERQARINLALQTGSEYSLSEPEDASGYPLNKSWNTDIRPGLHER